MSTGKNFAWPITSINKASYDLVKNFVSENKQDIENKNFILFGAGIRGTELATILKDLGVKNFVFVDNNEEKWGGNIDGNEIFPPAHLNENISQNLVLITTEESSSMQKQIEELGYFKEKNYFTLENNHYQEFVNSFSNFDNKELLVMGDCFFETISFDDTKRVSLAEYVGNESNDIDTSVLAIHGMNLCAFYHVYRLLVCNNKMPDYFCVMLNFEALTGKQHLLPRSQHHTLMKMIEDNLNDKDEIFSSYVELTKERVTQITSDFFTGNTTKSNENGKISTQVSKLFFKMYYLYDLKLDIEPLVAFNNILSLAKEKNITVIPFVPPVNYILGQEIFGDFFEERYEKNLQKLKNITTDYGFSLLDLSHISLPNEFAHTSTPDETMNEIGREKVAKAIISEVRKQKLERGN